VGAADPADPADPVTQAAQATPADRADGRADGDPSEPPAGPATASDDDQDGENAEPRREPVPRPLSPLGATPAVVAPRSARRRRAEQGIVPEEPIAPTGAGVAAAVAARRPGRPRNAGKAKPPIA
jgi:hypothetical protein